MIGFFYDMFITAAFAITIAMVWWVHDPKTLALCGAGGAIGFLVFRGVLQYSAGLFIPTLLSAIVMGMAAEGFARWRSIPVIVILAPSIYTLAPGSGMYETMLFLVHGNAARAMEKGLEVVAIAAAMAFGVLISSFLCQFIRRSKHRLSPNRRA